MELIAACLAPAIVWLAPAVKKFSGLQVGISNNLFTDGAHPPGRDSGANRLVKGVARLRLSRLSAIKMGSARRFIFVAAPLTVLVEPGRGDWKLQIAQGNKADAGEGFTPQLYNLKSDIGEKRDVATANPEIVAKLQSLVTAMKDDLSLIGKGAGCRELARKPDAKPLMQRD